MTPANEIIQSLTSLDLTTYPFVEVKNILRQIGIIGHVKNILHPGYDLMRVRPNKSVDEHFSSITDLRYKPQHLNKTYQRCSTPNRTMFYASSNIPNADSTIGRKTAVLETIPQIRDIMSELKEPQKVTFSRWRVTKELNLALICFDKDINKNFLEHEYVLDAFLQFLQNHPEHKERTVELNSFLAKSFSNPEPSGDKDYLYMISAIHTEILSENKLDGVIYPSVRTIGYGINIAITPEAADTKLKCIAVGEGLITKEIGEEIILKNLESIILSDGQTDFSFKST